MEQDTATVTLDGEPFNPQTVDLNHPNVTLQAFRPSGEAGTIQTHLYLAWTMDYNKARDHEDNVRPSWADLPQSERIYLTLSKSTANYVTRLHLAQPDGFITELPCPPYAYDRESGRLVISAGPYEKSGSKAEWEGVLKQMQTEVENMSEGIDVTDLPDITINVTIKSSSTVDVSVNELLEGHEQYDGELFTGDKYDLESALEESLENYEVDEYNVSTSDAYIDEIEVESNDLSYCMQQVDG